MMMHGDGLLCGFCDVVLSPVCDGLYGGLCAHSW